ncbi:fasciclin [Knoellia sinensis KCTC 19936]|uniref:Fasciclin n=1 Tax=Knoellia sinensis KCTC 19936 TaxID=1385520 RepID=A0A0A0J2E6_9MICO|nr:fasciclin domain-containing protein [Knoellia sinensis]KGN31505.1 fasciclin [Knoellia sinensis KCTC 19936]
MTPRTLVSALSAVGLAGLLFAPPATAGPPGTSTSEPTGTRSLAAVLTADGNQFDRNWRDYDIVTEAVLAVLATKPASPVGLLADGTVPLTAFIPNDRAFQRLVGDLTGSRLRSEQAVFDAVAGLGIDTVETVLLYHVIPGATLTSKQAAAANGAILTTAQGGTIGVRVLSKRLPLIQLRDRDPDDRNPFVNPRALDINKGNKQIAHGITLVLRPVDL